MLPEGEGELVQDDEDDDSQEETSTPLVTSGLRDRQILSDDQEVALLEFYRDNPIFYNKAKRDYKNCSKRDKLLKDFARRQSL